VEPPASLRATPPNVGSAAGPCRRRRTVANGGSMRLPCKPHARATISGGNAARRSRSRNGHSGTSRFAPQKIRRSRPAPGQSSTRRPTLQRHGDFKPRRWGGLHSRDSRRQVPLTTRRRRHVELPPARAHRSSACAAPARARAGEATRLSRIILDIAGGQFPARQSHPRRPAICAALGGQCSPEAATVTSLAPRRGAPEGEFT
jgi:hypothetical protein